MATVSVVRVDIPTVVMDTKTKCFTSTCAYNIWPWGCIRGFLSRAYPWVQHLFYRKHRTALTVNNLSSMTLAKLIFDFYQNQWRIFIRIIGGTIDLIQDPISEKCLVWVYLNSYLYLKSERKYFTTDKSFYF